MGMVAKTRPAVVLIADDLNAPRSLIIHIPITKQNRGSELGFVTRGTLTLAVPRLVAIVVGTLLVIVGVGIKVWAARTLGSNAYYWHNFFAPNDAQGPVSTGPYRFASNPMYTIGYLQTYGLALILGSLPGLLAAAFAQAAILALYFVVEKPHFERLHRS